MKRTNQSELIPRPTECNDPPAPTFDDRESFRSPKAFSIGDSCVCSSYVIRQIEVDVIGHVHGGGRVTDGTKVQNQSVITGHRVLHRDVDSTRITVFA